MLVISNIQLFGGRGGNRRSAAYKRYMGGEEVPAYPGEVLKKRTVFEGLSPRRTSNKYITMDRVSKDGEKVIVRVGDEMVKKTPYGYALILNDSKVVYLKDFNVSKNYYGTEVMLNKKYWNIKDKHYSDDIWDDNGKALKFDYWKDTAKEQQKAGNKVKWEDHYHSPKTIAILNNIGKSTK